MTPVACPACTGSQAKKDVVLDFRHIRSLQVLRCPTCTHRWAPTSTRLQAEIENKYAGHYNGFRVDSFFVQRVKQELAQRLGPVSGQGARLLDVGCGNGEFLQAAAQAGMKGRGVDVSEAAVEICLSKGVRADQADFLSFDFGDTFDLITLWDVMEHLREPGPFAERAGSLLSKRGTLVLKIPSPGALNFQILQAMPKRGGMLLGAPGHVQYFTETSLAKLLARAGFKHLLWFESRRFREPSAATTWKKRAARPLKSVIRRAARNQVLYVFAARREYSEDVIARVAPRRVEKL